MPDKTGIIFSSIYFIQYFIFSFLNLFFTSFMFKFFSICIKCSFILLTFFNSFSFVDKSLE
ncbi:hypothetical protein CXU22_03445 [Akkermansia muciniphila]|uniref:Uncharacterized protein n=1 Tax=Akkermansia muciniphila TaxID=239935 RepID=A0A2N8HF00_9BACT|nr:hypothetical protein CXU22_03445 [Akkermansia muciniphila]